MKNVFMASAAVSIIAVLLICAFLFAYGFPGMFKIGLGEFLTGTKWTPTDVPPSYGILPMIAGSLCVTLGAVVFGVPVGILTAVYMAACCPKRAYKFLKPAVELLAGIPSVVYGFFGIVVIVPVVHKMAGGLSGSTMLAAAFILGVMILPTVIGIAESAIRAVPEMYYEGAVALGAGHMRAYYFIVVPAARSGIYAGIVLGIGRAIGETMAVIAVAGNQARMPAGLLKGVRTMTANIVIEMSYAADLHREALIATGVVLFIVILVINLIFSLLNRKIQRY
jgi:phosphate transport system permease protein